MTSKLNWTVICPANWHSSSQRGGRRYSYTYFSSLACQNNTGRQFCQQFWAWCEYFNFDFARMSCRKEIVQTHFDLPKWHLLASHVLSPSRILFGVWQPNDLHHSNLAMESIQLQCFITPQPIDGCWDNICSIGIPEMTYPPKYIKCASPVWTSSLFRSEFGDKLKWHVLQQPLLVRVGRIPLWHWIQEAPSSSPMKTSLSHRFEFPPSIWLIWVCLRINLTVRMRTLLNKYSRGFEFLICFVVNHPRSDPLPGSSTFVVHRVLSDG